MEINKLLSTETNNNTDDFIESEKNKIKKMNEYNKIILNKLTTFIELLNKIELSINEKVAKQHNELQEIQSNILDNINIYKTICKNLII